MGGARLREGLPQPLRVLGRHEELEAVLAGVARTGDERRDPGDRARQARVVLQPVQVGVGDRLQDVRGGGALDGEQRVRVPVVTHLGVEAGDALGEGVQDGLGVARVGDDHVLGLAQAVDDQVVQDAAVLGDDHGVAGAARSDRGDVAHQGVVQEGGGLRAGDGDLAHVGQVEQTGPGADGVVLVTLTGVPQGHVPAGEVGHGRAQRSVQRVECGETGGSAHGYGSRA